MNDAIHLDELTAAVTLIRRAHHHTNTYTAVQLTTAYTTIQTIRRTATGQLRRWLDTFTIDALTAPTTGDLDHTISTLAEHLHIAAPAATRGAEPLTLNFEPDRHRTTEARNLRLVPGSSRRCR